MYVQKIHQFLWSIKKDAYKRKLVPFFLPHSVVSCYIHRNICNTQVQKTQSHWTTITTAHYHCTNLLFLNSLTSVGCSGILRRSSQSLSWHTQSGTCYSYQNKVKVKCALPHEECKQGAHLPFLGCVPVGWSGQCSARPMVTFLPAVHHHPLTSTKLYCMVTEAHVCVKARGWESDLQPSQSHVKCPNYYATRPLLPNRTEKTSLTVGPFIWNSTCQSSTVPQNSYI